MSTLTILGWICTGIGALSLAAILVVVVLAAAYDWQQKRATKKVQHRSYEASAYGPVRKFRTDLCMVATCNGIKSVHLGSGWMVCEDHARNLISGGDAA